jgi:hypothetical protein
VNLDADIRAQLPRAAEVMAGLSADQINWRPAEGSWSIAECIAHLNQLNGLYAASIAEALADARQRGWTTDGDATLGLLERWFLHSIEPPYKLKFKAPAKFRPPSSTFDREDLFAVWTSTHERLAELARESQGVDLKRVKVTSPATPLLKVSLLCALMVTPAHDRRHLWQAGRVRERLATR